MNDIQETNCANLARYQASGGDMVGGALWPQGISDGLTLPCGICRISPSFDWHADDETWRKVAPEEHRLSVICLPCFDRLAVGVTHNYIESAQFIGKGRTFYFNAPRMYVWADYKRPVLKTIRRMEEVK